MRMRDLSRRRFLGVVGAGVVVAGCSGQDGPGSGPGEAGGPRPGQGKESPVLAARVKSGDLPPLAERLPKEPFVVQPGVLVDEKFVKLEQGAYGGTLQLPQELPNFDPHVFLGNIEPMLWSPNGFGYAQGEKIVGNVVAGYEANSDNTVFTFHMREGLRWSDGELVTTEDVRFAFEDVLYNKQITPIFPDYLMAARRTDNAPAKLEVIDELTFSLTFDAEYGTFPAQIAIAQWRSYGDIIKPRHYLEQFHEKYADKKELQALLKEESIPADQWFNLFIAKQMGSWLDVSNEQFMGHPTLTAWVMTKASDGVFSFERNPYYFKVDTAGSQLPYIDELRSQLVQDKETLTSRALFGEFDYLGERASLRQISLIAEKADKGEVNMHVAQMHRLPISFALNLTHNDKVWREVVRDLRFRQALDLAINREEIIENFYLGEFASLPKETSNGVYDVAEANRLLDEMGLSEKDGEGFRLGPDGKRFRIPFEIEDLSEDHVPMGELIAEYWKKVGVFTTIRKVDATTRGERQEANQLKATAIWAAHDMWPSAGWDDYLPGTYWGPLWTLWNTSRGKDGEEPIPEVKELFDLHGQFMAAGVGSPDGKAALDGILKSYRDNVWTFNPVESSYYPTFWTKRVKNVPSGVKEEVFGIVVNISMEQWYIDE
jgi:peptide/nickel transport system substrate-binding protein